ncbi:hypothetical protein ID866_5427 [Astraeus odoratus]|nr:hypothetical protein ID866_5427 [Astraeus odoratus]
MSSSGAGMFIPLICLGKAEGEPGYIIETGEHGDGDRISHRVRAKDYVELHEQVQVGTRDRTKLGQYPHYGFRLASIF